MTSRDVVPLREATRVWGGIAVQSFGGPAGQIALMHRTIVDDKRWVGEQRFTHALSYCTLLPGPEAQQLAIYLGWLLNGVRGGLIAGTLFVLPGFAALLGLSWLYVAHGDVEWVAGLFAGLGPAVLAIVVLALVRLARRTLTHPLFVAIAVTAFVALAVFGVPFPLVILVAAIAGWIGFRLYPEALAPRSSESDSSAPEPLIPDDALHQAPVSAKRSVALLVFGVPLWLAPVILAGLWLGSDSAIAQQGWFFSGTALVTFGGAYAVLSFVAQRAVEDYGWLSANEMVTGLGFAETTPGPLIMVVQFVAFLGAFRAPGELNPWVAAVLGSALTVWVTFVPCFLLVFAGAPYVERLRGQRGLSAALRGITAAVVGVIANLAWYFAVHTVTSDAELPLLAPALAVGAGWLLGRRGWSVVRVLAVCALVGAVASLWVGAPGT